MLVGNDVVDLRDSESRPEALHARFDARVFDFDEQEAVRVSRSAHELRWSLWAAKESAFKVAKKIDRAVRFVPREFRVSRVVEGRALVIHETGAFDVRLNRTSEWVHALATLAAANAPSTGGSISTGIGRLEAPGADPSRVVRELACGALSSRMDLALARVRIAADDGIPVVVSGERRLAVDLSLSHHGRFVAWAWASGFG